VGDTRYSGSELVARKLTEMGATMRVHEPCLELEPDQVVAWVGHPLALVDCFGILDDARIQRYFELGCEVKALGRGHIQRIKERVRAARQT
jgi:hypothetical protein